MSSFSIQTFFRPQPRIGGATPPHPSPLIACAHSAPATPVVLALSVYENPLSRVPGPRSAGTCHGSPASPRLVLAERQPVGPNETGVTKPLLRSKPGGPGAGEEEEEEEEENLFRADWEQPRHGAIEVSLSHERPCYPQSPALTRTTSKPWMYHK